MMTFEEVRGQLGTKVFLGSQGDILTEKVMQLISEAVHEERNNAQAVVNNAFANGYQAGLNEPRITQVGNAIPFEVLEQVANAHLEGLKSNPARTAILGLMAELSTLDEVEA